MYRYFLRDFTREGERITIERSEFIDGCLPTHDHDFLEIFYVLDGKGYHCLNNEISTIEKGDLIFLSYQSTHKIEPIDKNLTWINVSFFSDFIDSSLITEYNANEIIRLSVFKSMFSFSNGELATDITIKNRSDEFETLILQMEKEYTEKNYGYIQILKHYLLILLTKIFRNNYDHNNDRYKLNNDNLIKSVIEELDKNIGGEVSLDLLAKKVYMNPKYLSRLFKNQVGIGFAQFMHKKRIDKACELLENTDFSVYDVMLNVGYNDCKYFYSLFKRIMNMTPNQYRKSRFKI